MSVWEAVVTGIFKLLDTAFYVCLLLMFLPPLMRIITKHAGGSWGQPDGSLPAFSPRRLVCKHQVAWYGPGTHGLWANWCDACGKKIGGR